MIINNNMKIYIGDTPIEQIYQGESYLYSAVPPHTELQYFTVKGDSNFRIDYNYDDKHNVKLFISFSNGLGHDCDIFRINSSDFVYLWDHWGSNIGWYYNGYPARIWTNKGWNTSTIYVLESEKNGQLQVGYIKDISGNTYVSGQHTSQNYIRNNGASLFGNPSGNYAFSGRFYELIVSDNNQIIYDFVPALDKEGAVCIYDKINKTFAYPIVGNPIAGPVKEGI